MRQRGELLLIEWKHLEVPIDKEPELDLLRMKKVDARKRPSQTDSRRRPRGDLPIS